MGDEAEKYFLTTSDYPDCPSCQGSMGDPEFIYVEQFTEVSSILKFIIDHAGHTCFHC